jgi:predicted nucleotide-binding protein
MLACEMTVRMMHNMPTASGYWKGILNRTPNFNIDLYIQQDGDSLCGNAIIYEHLFERHEFTFRHGTDKEGISIELGYRRANENLPFGYVTLNGKFDGEDHINGTWVTNTGMDGNFSLERLPENNEHVRKLNQLSVFIVHGHDDGAKESVARYVAKLGLKPIILNEQENKGRPLIQKLEETASLVGYAVILMTPDDSAYSMAEPSRVSFRARQNVILELGYFIAKLGRDRVAVFVKGNLEQPSDYLGVVFEPFDNDDGWKLKLARELRQAGYNIDMNNTIE